ncbi:MAG: hypothetical protein IPI26_05700 [Elusimicrobia bacterium]|nr:hypothetical protein [Elusimicrobiota bacterium]
MFHHAPLRQHAHAVPRVRRRGGRAPGQFWEYAERLFERQKSGRPTCRWRSTTRALSVGRRPRPGLDAARFTADMDGTTADRVRQDRETADRIAIPATPTVFVKDRMLVGSSQIASWAPVRSGRWINDPARPRRGGFGGGGPSAFAGAVLVFSGFLKAIRPPEEFAALLSDYWILPPALLVPLARGVPWVEMWVGLCLLTGSAAPQRRRPRRSFTGLSSFSWRRPCSANCP